MPIARTNDGIALSYKTNGSGRCHLLFMHDWGGSGAYFDELLKYLDFTGLRTITYDLRGHGNSDKPSSGYTLQRFAQDVFNVADHAGATKFTLIGFGMSAKFAQYAATLNRERINGLILIAGCPASPVSLSIDMYQDWINSAGNRERLLDVKRMLTTRPLKPEGIDRWVDDAIKISKQVLGDTLKMMIETSFADRLELINCPVIVIGGLHDPIFTPDILRNQVAAPLGNVRLAILNCNHEIPSEQPRELAGLIEAFLAGMKAVTVVRQSQDK